MSAQVSTEAPPALFDVSVPVPQRSKRQPAGKSKPTWNSYAPKGQRHRCDECAQLSFETLPGPAPHISQAYFSRRQDGVTAYYCYPHASLQRAEDDKTFAGQAAEQKGRQKVTA